MKRSQLVVQSLRHHWRTNLAVLFGVVAGTAVISGALIVGDSVKASLRRMTLERLGKIDYAMIGSRFVREKFADEITAESSKTPTTVDSQTAKFSPAIVMRAGIEAKSGETRRRAGQVNVYGFDDRASSLIETGGTKPPTGTNVVLNSRTATAIGAAVGDEITLWIELPSAVPRDTLLGNKDSDSQEIVLTVSAIAAEQTGLAKLGLQPTQASPLNAFVDLHVLQDRLGLEAVKPSRSDPVGKPPRINAVLADDGFSNQKNLKATRSTLLEITKAAWSLADLSLKILDNSQFGGIVVESEQMILEDKLSVVARKTADEMNLLTSPVQVYLANKLWNPKIEQGKKQEGYAMYSTVAGLDVPQLEGTPFSGFQFIGDKPTTWGDDDAIINEFLAADLQVNVGDEIKFTYHTVGSRGELPELEKSVTVRGIVAMTGAAVDRTLTPEVKGITDVDSLADWDQPFPMDLDAVTSRDDEYWNSYRAIPKMYLPLKTAQKLWPSRYGSLTSLRIARPNESREERSEELIKKLHQEFAEKLLRNLDPGELGLVFQPVKEIGLRAASGSTDFSGLFFGFSLFLIVAAMILIGLLFRLGTEQRVRELGLLGAIGFTAKEVRQQLYMEGFLILAAGTVIGTVAAIAYAKLMIYGLTHWWIGAIGTKELVLSVQPLSLTIGLMIALIAGFVSIAWAMRQLKKLSLREQLAGVTELETDLATEKLRATRAMRRASVCALIALLLMASVVVGVIPATGAFFGIGTLLLVASLSYLSAKLRRESGVSVKGHGVAAFARLSLRNATRQRQRTIMTAGMIATATFLIVAVAAFRRDPTSELPVKNSGNGGYTLVAESSSPVLYDLNTPEGRKKLQLVPSEDSAEAKLLAKMNVVPFRVKPGEDASCLNLYQTSVPTILGAPQSFIEQHRFAFASGSWKSLEGDHSSSEQKRGSSADVPIPVLGDMNTLMFSLHKQVGQTIAVPNDESPQHQLLVKGMFQDSVFQGVLVMSEEDFLKLYPEQKGFRYFLIDVPSEDQDAAIAYLETELAEYGFDAEPVADRLARFLSVQNTYLSTFQTLGGLGLLLGTFGLATVMLRNVLERQSELALLRAIGFRRSGVANLVLWENGFILLWGLTAGSVSAILATSPNLLSRGANLPWPSLAVLLIVVFITGMIAALFAVISASRLPIVTTLRGE